MGRRIWAVLIDGVLLTGLFILMALLFGDAGTEDDSSFNVTLEGGGFVAFAGLAFAYYIVPEASWGASAGKLLLGLRVVREDGQPIGFGGAFLRNILRIVDGLFFYLVGLVFIAISPKRQRLGDLAAHTLVVRRPTSRSPRY